MEAKTTPAAIQTALYLDAIDKLATAREAALNAYVGQFGKAEGEAAYLNELQAHFNTINAALALNSNCSIYKNI